MRNISFLRLFKVKPPSRNWSGTAMDGSTMMSAIMWTASVILTGASYGSSGVLADRENLVSFHQPIPTVAGGKYSGTYSSSTVSRIEFHRRWSVGFERGQLKLSQSSKTQRSPGTMTLSFDALTANHRRLSPTTSFWRQTSRRPLFDIFRDFI
jgi:hypothetical protein